MASLFEACSTSCRHGTSLSLSGQKDSGQILNLLEIGVPLGLATSPTMFGAYTAKHNKKNVHFIVCKL